MFTKIASRKKICFNNINLRWWLYLLFSLISYTTVAYCMCVHVSVSTLWPHNLLGRSVFMALPGHIHLSLVI